MVEEIILYNLVGLYKIIDENIILFGDIDLIIVV